MRESVWTLTGLDQREMYGQSDRVKDQITIADLANWNPHVVSDDARQRGPGPGVRASDLRPRRARGRSGRWRYGGRGRSSSIPW